MTTRARTLALLSLYTALDDSLFASSADRPALDVVYQTRFAAYHQALVVSTAAADTFCALCGAASNDLSPLETDYLYERAVREYSMDRDDCLCKRCRDDFEHDYGLYPSDASDYSWDDR